MIEPIGRELDALGKQVVDAAYKVHKALGPGLLESAYESCFSEELSGRGILIERQKELPIIYNQKIVEAGFRIDVLVDGKVLVELKSVEKILRIHQAQLLTYLKLSGLRLGYPINFNVPLIRDGIERKVL